MNVDDLEYSKEIQDAIELLKKYNFIISKDDPNVMEIDTSDTSEDNIIDVLNICYELDIPTIDTNNISLADYNALKEHNLPNNIVMGL